jgi:phenylacetic acid degradation operon negative regulatory protein
MPLPAQLLSTIRRVPLSYYVYSSFSYFGRIRGGELPGGWFVTALAAAGRDAAAVRQTLFRMERDEELITRKQGRMKFYAPSAYARAEIEAGTEKIFEEPGASWDGLWTVVRVGLRTPALAKHRERVIALLSVEGFAQLDANVFVHPRPAADRLLAALPGRARAEVAVLRGELLGADAADAFVRLWPIEQLAKRYRRVLDAFDALDAALERGLSDRDAFLMRFAVVFEHLGVAWEDPNLPRQLLPADWPGAESRRTAGRLYRRLRPAAIRFADAVLDDVRGATRPLQER